MTSSGLDRAIAACETTLPGLAHAILSNSASAPGSTRVPALAPRASAHQQGFVDVLLSRNGRPVPSGDADWRPSGGAQPAAERSPQTGRKRPRHDEHRICCNCGSNKTPFWRKHRASGKPLCNACGLYSAKNADAPRPAKLWREEQATQQAANRMTGSYMAPTGSMELDQHTLELQEVVLKDKAGALGKGPSGGRSGSDNSSSFVAGDCHDDDGRAGRYQEVADPDCNDAVRGSLAHAFMVKVMNDHARLIYVLFILP